MVTAGDSQLDPWGIRSGLRGRKLEIWFSSCIIIAPRPSDLTHHSLATSQRYLTIISHCRLKQSTTKWPTTSRSCAPRARKEPLPCIGWTSPSSPSASKSFAPPVGKIAPQPSPTSQRREMTPPKPPTASSPMATTRLTSATRRATAPWSTPWERGRDPLLPCTRRHHLSVSALSGHARSRRGSDGPSLWRSRPQRRWDRRSTTSSAVVSNAFFVAASLRASPDPSSAAAAQSPKLRRSPAWLVVRPPLPPSKWLWRLKIASPPSDSRVRSFRKLRLCVASRLVYPPLRFR